MKKSILLFPVLLAAATAANAIPSTGQLEGFAMSGGQLVLEGWACRPTELGSISVHVYMNGPYPQGTIVGSAEANLTRPPGNERFPACRTNESHYRFEFPLSGFMASRGGQSIYVYTFPDSVLLKGGAGELRVPNRVATAVGDSVTDDTDALNAAIALPGVTYIPKNAYGKTYLVTSKIINSQDPTRRRILEVDSNREVVLDGTLFLKSGTLTGSTDITAPNTRQIGVLQIKNGAHDVRIHGRGTVDGNRANQHQCCIAGILAGGPTLGDYSAGISNIDVRDLTIRNTFNWPISIDGTNGATLKNLKIYGGGNSVQFSHGTRNAHAYGLIVDDVDDIGFSFYNDVATSSIQGSIVTNSGGAGIGVLGDNPLPWDVGKPLSTGITITGNEVHRSRSGVETLNGNIGSGLTLSFSNIDVGNNKVYGSYSHSYGFNSCVTCSLHDNESYTSGSGGKDVIGIGRWIPGVYVSESSNVTITGNSFHNEGQGENGNGVGVTVDVTGNDNNIAVANITINGNSFRDTQAAATMRVDIAQTPPGYPNVITRNNNVSCGITTARNVCTTPASGQ